NAGVGDGSAPLDCGGIDGGEGGDVQAVEEIFLYIAHAVFHPPFFVCLAHIAGDGLEAVVSCQVQVAWMKEGLFPRGMAQHADLQVVDDDLFAGALKKFEGVPVTAQELLHTFGEGELEVHESAVAQHHDKEAQAPSRRADGKGAEVAPVDLGTFAGSELQHQKGGLAGRTNLADKLLKNGVAAGVAPLTQLLEAGATGRRSGSRSWLTSLHHAAQDVSHRLSLATSW